MTPHLELDTPRLAGNCDIDVDECDSSPCQNDATCTESSDVLSDTSVHAFTCACLAGFANGACAYDVIAEFNIECSVAESSANLEFAGQDYLPSLFVGTCDIDVNECASDPCQNGATCSDSATRNGSPGQLRRCDSVWLGPHVGLVNVFTVSDIDGSCNLDIEEFVEVCAVYYDECVAFMQDTSDDARTQWAERQGETSVHPGTFIDTYTCRCEAGFANGWCEYNFDTRVQ